MLVALIDSGPIIAYFDQSDEWHKNATSFIDAFVGQLITTAAVIAEVMWLLRSDYRVQNEFLRRIALGVFRNEPLTEIDFMRIAELNARYSDLRADFADLSLIAVAERLDIASIVSVDSEFDIYRRQLGHNQVPFQRIFHGHSA